MAHSPALPLQYLVKVGRWKVRRRFPAVQNFAITGRSQGQLLFIHEPTTLCLTQVYPFYYYHDAIARRFGLRLVLQTKEDFIANPLRFGGKAAVVMVQPWYLTPAEVIRGLLQSIKTHNPSAKVVFVDGMSPVDLRLAHILGDDIDLYVKKHVLRDRSQYGKPTRGDTNLTDYYLKAYDLPGPEVTYPIPKGFLNKIIVGPSFFTAPRLFGRFLHRATVDHADRTIDMHGRIAWDHGDWYGHMRGEARAKLDAISGLTIPKEPNVPLAEFYRELDHSKTCFSPFGYGEGCHRDYESVYAGALLLKPDMSHVETWPDIFVPHETYVPIDWRFTDLEEKCRHYLKHENERRAIVDRAYAVLREYCRAGDFLDQMKPVFDVS
jgi:hypothetical protein